MWLLSIYTGKMLNNSTLTKRLFIKLLNLYHFRRHNDTPSEAEISTAYQFHFKYSRRLQGVLHLWQQFTSSDLRLCFLLTFTTLQDFIPEENKSKSRKKKTFTLNRIKFHESIPQWFKFIFLSHQNFSYP